MNNLSQIGIELKMYLDDSNSKFPPYLSWGSPADANGDMKRPDLRVQQ